MKVPTADLILEDKRALLRVLTYQDYESLLSFSIKEPELWTYSLVQGGGEENLKRYIDLAIEGLLKGTSLPFIVFDKLKNAYAGSTRFYDIQSHHKSTQLGFTWYGKDFQRTGLNTHCKHLMLNYAFEEWGMERVEFRADANNQRSIKAMRRIGCVEEGILRNNCTSPTGRRSSIVLSILKSEWKESVKERFQDML